MNTMKRTVGTVILTLVAATTVAAIDHTAVLDAIPAEPLNDAERQALVYMAEEEKLARDVYTTLGEVWNVPVFDNIARAEQQHIDSVGSLLDRYDIPRPATMATPGSFTDPDLQQLYDDLVAQGSDSLEAAMTVGATIEDVDIADLVAELRRVDNRDIRLVFENLIAGSENHMRAFVGQLTRLGAGYEPQYIDRETFDAIVADAGSAPRRGGVASNSASGRGGVASNRASWRGGIASTSASRRDARRGSW